MRRAREQLAVVLCVALLSMIFLILPLQPRKAAYGQTCGSEYVIKEGESLAQIAAKVYGSPSQWTIIFYANQDRLGANASLLVPGLSIKLPCITATQQPEPLPEAATTPAAPIAPAPFELSSLVRRIEFLTADGYTPFTGRSLPNGGMLTNVLSASMDLIKNQAKGAFNYNISWVNDWAAHLNPLLITRAFDVGFPWVKPDCDNFPLLDQDGKYRCQKFFFSDPLYEIVTVLFVKKDSPIAFASDDEIVGKTLCQPAGYATYELDKGGRNWVKDNKIILMRPQTMEECFRLLDSGAVNAVVTSDLTGQALAASLNMADRVRALERPLAIGTLHVIVTKTHPHARTILYYVNSALAKLKETGEYEKIVEDHLARFWGVTDPEAETPSATGSAQTPPKGAAAAQGDNAQSGGASAKPASPSAKQGSGKGEAGDVRRDGKKQ